MRIVGITDRDSVDIPRMNRENSELPQEKFEKINTRVYVLLYLRFEF